MLSAVSWIGGAGDWSVAGNWSGGTVPTSMDDVNIPTGANVTISTNQSVSTLTTASGSSLTLNTGVQLWENGGTLNGAFEWDGTLAGSANALTLAGSTVVKGATYYAPLVNTGNLTFNGGKLYGGAFTNSGIVAITNSKVLGGGVTFTNAVGATVSITDDEGFTGDYSGTFINRGTFSKTGGTGTCYFAGYFKNVGGIINVNSGNFTLSQSADLDGGQFNVAPGSTLSIDNGTPANPYGYNIRLAGTLTGSGGGSVRLNSGGIYPQGADGSASGATLNFPEGMLEIGNVYLYAQNGNTITNTGFLSFVGSAGFYSLALVNQGTVTSTTTANLPFLHFVNDTTGTLDLKTDASLSGSLTNKGTIRKSGGTGVTLETGYLLNSGGTLDIRSGTFTMTQSNDFEGGQYNVETGSTLSIDNGTPTNPYGYSIRMSGALVGSGGGTFSLNSGLYYPLTSAATPTVATLNFPQGMLQVGNVYMQAQGGKDITNTGFLQFVGSVGHGWTGMVNQGTITNEGTADLAFGTFLNDTTGVILLENDAKLANSGGMFTNKGVICKSGGTGTTVIASSFKNEGGALDVQSGTMRLQMGTFGYTAGPVNIEAGATLEIALGVGTMYTSGTFTSTGDGKVMFISGYMSGPSSSYGQDTNAPGILNFAPDTFYVNGGLFNDYTNLVNTGSIYLTGDKQIGSLVNRGSVFVDAGSVLFYGRFVNEATGILNFTADTTTQVGGWSGLSNAGLLIKSGGAGTLALGGLVSTYGYSLYFDNQGGTYEVTSGILLLPNEPTLFLTGNDGYKKIAAGSTIIVHAGASVVVNTAPTITQNAGTVILAGAGALFPSLASLNNNSGTFEVLSRASFVTTGNLSNSGTLTVGGHLTVTGNFAQTSDGTLNFSVAALPGARAPSFTVTGTTSLAGHLTAGLSNGFGSSGDAYTAASFATAATGGFSSIAAGPAFTAQVNPTNIILTGSGAANLEASTISAPPNFTPGETDTITWQVSNIASVDAIGSWVDSVYLTRDGTISSSAILLGRVQHDGGMASGADYTGSLEVTFPGAAGKYKVVVVTDSKLALPDTDRSNNTASSSFISTVLPVLTVGSTAHSTIVDQQDQVYRLSLSAGQNVVLNASFALANEAEVFVRYGAMPTAALYDFSGNDTLATLRQILISALQSGDYFVLVHGREGAATAQAYSLAPTLAAFKASAILPAVGGTGGHVTIQITGEQFTSETTASLTLGGTTLTSTSTNVQFVDEGTLFATFDLSQAAAGAYTVKVLDGAASATLGSLFQVVPASASGLEFNLISPSVVRGGRDSTLLLQYSNNGNTDIPAPYFCITSTNGKFRLPSQSGYSDDAMELLGINGVGPAGVLTPGASGEIKILFQQKVAQPHGIVNVSATVLDDKYDVTYLSRIQNQLRPVAEPEQAWSEIYHNFLTRVGTTLGGFTQVLRDAATAMSEQGVYTDDPAVLFNYVLNQAGDFGAITRRWTQSEFGYGQADPINMTASADASGNVIITASGKQRVFLLGIDSRYTGVGGDAASLTLSAGVYTLRENDGQITVFGTNGKLDYYQDTNGNRITAHYTNSRLTSLVETNGDTYTYAYNANGYISQVTDPVGRITTYAYNSVGDLTSITTPQGTTTITPGIRHLIASIAYPDGTHRYYTYDSSYRLTQTSRDGGAEVVNFTYDNLGNVTATDALGNATTTVRNADSSVAAVINGLGNIARIAYDLNGRPTSVTTPGGFRSTLSYDANGNMVKVVDASGNLTSFSYDSTLNRLLSMTDANDNQTVYAYDANGNVASITDSAGQATTYSYDLLGNVTQATTAESRGQTITYNSKQQVTLRTFSDGSTISYTYDAHRNLLTAADSVSGTVAYTYDSADRLTSMTDPNGLSLNYTYDSAGRLVTMEDQTGFTTHYLYDSLGRLWQLTDGSSVVITSYTYDAAGQLSRKDNANGSITTYAYDAAGHTTEVVNHASASSINSSFQYTYNSNGQRSSMTTEGGTTIYTYDATGELTEVELPGGRTIGYGYDAVGNRVAVTDSAASTVNYTTNNLDQYISVGGTTYTYDKDGNLISSTDGSDTTTYTYNVRGELSSLVTPGHTFTYLYDALGNRISSTDNGLTTNYLVNPMGYTSVSGEFSNTGEVISHYVNGLGLTSCVNALGVSSFYDFDGTGNTADITGANGAATSTYAYLPFGEVLSSTGSGSNLFTYNGQFGVQNAGGGLYFMRQRSYDPTTGRFNQRDPSGLAGQDVNLYRYANNDPVDNVDPQGTVYIGVYSAVSGSLASTQLNLASNLVRATLAPQVIATAAPLTAPAATQTAVTWGTRAVTLTRTTATAVGGASSTFVTAVGAHSHTGPTSAGRKFSTPATNTPKD